MIRANKIGASASANYDFIESKNFADNDALNTTITPTARTNRKFIVIARGFNNGNAPFSGLTVTVNSNPITATQLDTITTTTGNGYVAEFTSDSADAITITQTVDSGFGWYLLQEVY